MNKEKEEKWEKLHRPQVGTCCQVYCVLVLVRLLTTAKPAKKSLISGRREVNFLINYREFQFLVPPSLSASLSAFYLAKSGNENDRKPERRR